jgi:hypothetical protein
MIFSRNGLVPKRAVEKRALLVGINYVGSSNELYGCVRDVGNVATFLTGRGYSCVAMTDTTPKRPTRANILAALETMLRATPAGSSCFFHFSGHGTSTRDRSGDETDGKDECIIASDFRTITDDELRALVDRCLVRGATLFALFDSCFSGTMLDLKYIYLPNATNPRVPVTAGRVVAISGCRDNQSSADAWIDRVWQGAMTSTFLACAPRSYTLNLLLQNMRSTLSKQWFTQVPQLTSGTALNMARLRVNTVF